MEMTIEIEDAVSFKILEIDRIRKRVKIETTIRNSINQPITRWYKVNESNHISLNFTAS